MSRRKLLTVAGAALVVAGMTGTAATAQAAPVGAGASGWTSDPLPVTGVNLVGVAQPDAQTTWAAGYVLTQAKGSVHTPVLLTRTNGGSWVNTATAPLPAGAGTRFNAVSADSGDDGWLVGDYTTQTGGIVTEHWNGTAWTLENAPAPAVTDASDAEFIGVSGLGPDDAWAAGYAQVVISSTTDPTTGQVTENTDDVGLVEHWDGTAWTIQQLPQKAGVTLTTVTEVSATDVWAAGYLDADQPVLAHYNGHAWTYLPTPAYNGLYGEFYSITASGPNDVWAAGRDVETETDTGHGLVEHWNGTKWQQVTTPAAAAQLSSIAMTPQGVVAVGRTTLAPYPGPGADGYAMRYANGAWTSLNLPSGTEFDPQAVVASGADQLTLVGNISDPTQQILTPMVLTGDN